MLQLNTPCTFSFQYIALKLSFLNYKLLACFELKRKSYYRQYCKTDFALPLIRVMKTYSILYYSKDRAIKNSQVK